MVGLTRDDLAKFAEKHAMRCDDLTVVDRTVIADARKAREAAYMRINQLELPFNQAGKEA